MENPEYIVQQLKKENGGDLSPIDMLAIIQLLTISTEIASVKIAKNKA